MIRIVFKDNSRPALLVRSKDAYGPHIGLTVTRIKTKPNRHHYGSLRSMPFYAHLSNYALKQPEINMHGT